MGDNVPYSYPSVPHAYAEALDAARQPPRNNYVRPDGRIGLNGDAVRSFPQVTHPRRRRLMELIEERPGLNIKELAHELQMFRTGVKHHIRSLRRAGLVEVVRQGRHVLHFSTNMKPLQREALALLRIESVRQVCLQLLAHPQTSLQQLAQLSGLGLRTVQRAVKRLRDKSLVLMEPQEKPYAYHFHLHHELRTVLVLWSAPEWEGKLPSNLPEPIFVPGILAALIKIVNVLTP